MLCCSIFKRFNVSRSGSSHRLQFADNCCVPDLSSRPWVIQFIAAPMGGTYRRATGATTAPPRNVITNQSECGGPSRYVRPPSAMALAIIG